MDITRRSLLATASLIPLADCAGGTAVLPTWARGIQAIGDVFAAALPALQAAGLSGSALAKVSDIISQITAAAAAIGAVATPVQGQSTLVTIEQYINALAPLVAPFAASVPGLGIAVAALPAIEELLNIFVSLLTPQAKTLAASRPTAARVSPNQALNELLAMTGR